jgi:hypothetical protein
MQVDMAVTQLARTEGRAGAAEQAAERTWSADRGQLRSCVHPRCGRLDERCHPDRAIIYTMLAASPRLAPSEEWCGRAARCASRVFLI